MPAPDETRLYLWQGPRVLKNYSSGVVVIAATSEEAAWEILRKADEMAYWVLA